MSSIISRALALCNTFGIVILVILQVESNPLSEFCDNATVFSAVSATNVPKVELIGAEFYTNDKYHLNATNTSQLIPITVHSLTFSCVFDHVTVWKFATPPHNDSNIKDVSVAKRRHAKDICDNSTYTYNSTLTIRLKTPDFLSTIYCAYKSFSFSKVEFNPADDKYYINATISQFQENVYTHIKSDKRLGKNEGCNLSMKIDTESKKFKCGNGSLPRIFHCNNPDECNSIFDVDYLNETHSRPEKPCLDTFSNESCTTLDNCSKLSLTYSPAVIACQDHTDGNSIARRYFVYRSESGPVMRLARDTYHPEETIRIAFNSSQYFFGQSMRLSCEGAASYYSKGFRWGISTPNQKWIFLENDTDSEESFDEEFHNYKIEKIINTNDIGCKESCEIIVHCFGPRWSTSEWVNCSQRFNISESEPPTIETFEVEEIAAESDAEPDRIHFHVKCAARGKPTPDINWNWNTHASLKDVRELPGFRASLPDCIEVRNEENYYTESNCRISWLKSEALKIECNASNFLNFAIKGRSYKPSDSMWFYLCGGIALLIALCVLALICTRRHYRKKFQLLTDQDINEFEHGNMTADNQALVVPYPMEKEIDHTEFTIECCIGEGQYGIVYRGQFRNLPVAVKTIKKTADVKYFKAILMEIKILCFVGEHRNLVNIIGASTRNIRKREIFLITEFCNNGDMLSYLKRHRTNFKDVFHPNSDETTMKGQNLVIDIDAKNDSLEIVKGISTAHLINWAYDIASAMEFLSSKNVIHGDLAARNVLLSDILVAKVCDFGLSKQLAAEYAVYVQQQSSPLPLKWLAIECLRDFEFSVESDIWSFGVTLWEIFSLGCTPYPGIPHWTYESYTLLKKGYRMDPPYYSNDNIYQVMLACWNDSPKNRPKFTELKNIFHQWKLQVNSHKRLLTMESALKSKVVL